MITQQAQEMLARIELNKMLTEKGRKRIWRVDRIHNEQRYGKETTIYTFESQEYLPYKLQVTV